MCVGCVCGVCVWGVCVGGVGCVWCVWRSGTMGQCMSSTGFALPAGVGYGMSYLPRRFGLFSVVYKAFCLDST